MRAEQQVATAGKTIQPFARTLISTRDPTQQTTVCPWVNVFCIEFKTTPPWPSTCLRALLIQGQSLVSAALMAGFTDQSHMTRQFSKTYGLSPARWMKMHRR